MGHIKNRILEEHQKYYNKLDNNKRWAELAETKILSEIRARLEDSMKKIYYESNAQMGLGEEKFKKLLVRIYKVIR